MRKNTKEAIRRWQDGRASIPSQHGSSIWTDGDSLWSYQTCIATKVQGKVYVNGTKYSPTTTRHQSGLMTWLRNARDVKFNEWLKLNAFDGEGYGVSLIPHNRGAGPAQLMLGVVWVDIPELTPVDEWLPEVVRYVTV